MSELTPMQKQLNEIKVDYPNELIFFRLGDFYEMFGEDAIEASKILNITLTSRNKGKPNELPMCGVPYHAADGYLAKLTKAGKRVAICDQVSDPTLPGIVKRRVVRVVTPGTTLDESVLGSSKNNYVACLLESKGGFGFALCDNTTGEFQAASFTDITVAKNELYRLQPAELIVPAVFFNNETFASLLEIVDNVHVFQLPGFDDAASLLKKHFNVDHLGTFGIESLPLAIDAAALLLGYLQETQKTQLEHILTIRRYAIENCMVLDQATMRNLELTYNAWTFEVEGSLLGVMDQTMTGMGGRLLRKWLVSPLIVREQIEARLAAVENLRAESSLLTTLSDQLKSMTDFERLLGRLGNNRASARDIVALKNSVSLLPGISVALANADAPLLQEINDAFPDHEALVTDIEKTLVDDPPVSLTDGGTIRDGVNKELDEIRIIRRTGKQWLADYQMREAERTGIATLKVKYNKVFGYYIEVSKAQLQGVPEEYIRKQTLVNAERFITPELKEYEDKILNAEERIVQIETELFTDLRERIIKHIAAIQKSAQLVAQLDVLCSFAMTALAYGYCRPTMVDDGTLVLTESRHPVIEQFQKNYVPNDVLLNHTDAEFVLLTGPNMSGKSSYLRQVALITLMAHMGSFVPAESATIGIVDRIFTRVGASDNVAQGVSTFMNEMIEAGNILHNATEKSLIILDEIGRGTSTYDGLSIAWAISEYIHNTIKAKTLFATHYHELVGMLETLKRAQNYCVAVSEHNNEVIFLHKIIKGASSQSYGIEVAKMAGLPSELIMRAQAILHDLEASEGKTHRGLKPKQTALPIFTSPDSYSWLKERLEACDVQTMTPIEALNELDSLIQQIHEKNV